MGTLIEIVPYDPAWNQAYSGIETALHKLLDGVVKSIDHVGSTAVAGLAAKPYIDIDVVLKDDAHMEHCRHLMETFGYEARGSRYGDGVWAFMLREPLPRQRVYLCPPGSDTHDKRMRFRDILRKSNSIAKAYTVLKQELAMRYLTDGDRYTQAKTQFIENALKDFGR